MKSQVIGLYLRLSNEDEYEVQESNSITSQREILKDYIQHHREFRDCFVIEFCDEGYSGTNFERPGVQRLLEQTKRGEIHTIIVKDFSRFGRNYIEVGNYLEQVFPFLGVRFISVNDEFDSGSSDFSGEYFDIAFKNLIYDLYSKDLSEKIISVRRMKASQGKFITSYAPYGYQKSKEQRLVPDSETAPIVRRIFDMAVQGIPKAHIANTLNKEGVLSPLMLRRQRGEHFPCKTVNEKSFWKTSKIFSILKDQRYTGDAVYGKVKPTTVGSSKDCAVPEEEWIIVPNAHEAIVSREIFEKVNDMVQKRNKYSQDKTAALKGKVRCATCNHIISRKKRVHAKGEITATYRCNGQNMIKEFGCCTKTIEESQIEYTILTMLQKAASIVVDTKVLEITKEFSASKEKKLEKLLIKYETEIKQLTNHRLERYKAYKDGLLLREDFVKEKIALEKRIDMLLLDIEKCKQELWKIKCADTKETDAILQLEKFAPFHILTREIVEIFVKQIYICQDGSLQIEWKFEDIYSYVSFHKVL
jgi:DNA invertase Pin-like site-specific DNA recombinase